MVTWLKHDKSRIGITQRVYLLDLGNGKMQSRMTVKFPYGTVDADVSEFEVSEKSQGKKEEMN